MNIDKKKRAIIEHIKKSSSEDLVSRVYLEILNDKDWTKTQEGIELLGVILEKSQNDVREGKVFSNEEVQQIITERYNPRKVI
jgi:hypothetical protein